jgi:bacterioferritin-associated ferredoxin
MCSIALSLHTLTRLLSPKQQGDVALKPHVASACFKCFKCFRGMLQVFYIDITKVDRDVAHVAMVFSSVCPKCFICFRRVLQVFHLDFAK